MTRMLIATWLASAVAATGCLDAEDPASLDTAESPLISTSLRAVASRANTGLCFENVSAQIRLRPCDTSRNQQKVEAEVSSVSGPTLRLIKLRASSGNCFDAGTSAGNLVVLRPCDSATSWFELDFSGNSVTPRTREQWTVFARALDDFRGAWRRAWYAACRETRVAGAQSEDRLDARMRCLDRATLAARALLHLPALSAPIDPPAAIAGAVALPDPEACRAVASLHARLPPPPAAGPVLEKLDRVRLLAAMGKREAFEDAQAAVADAERAGYGPALAELGKAWWTSGRLPDAIASFERGYFETLAAGDDAAALKLSAM